jgi:ferritin heavy chain
MNTLEFNCRQNWSKECETHLNTQINLELTASHKYLFLSTYFGRDDIALQPLVKYFEKASLEEREHARVLIDYQNMRGGIVNLSLIPDPELFTSLKTHDFSNVLDAFKIALNLEKMVNQNLLDLHTISDNNKDPQFCDFLEGTYLNEQVEAISELSKIITQLTQIGDNKYGIWDFVQKL